MSSPSTNPFSLAGKTILVTGASSGIGRQIALSCAEAGATLIISGRDEARLYNLLSSLQGEAHKAITADLSTDAGIETLSVSIGKIDGIVYSAGISHLAPMRMISRTHVQDQFNTNTIAPMLLTKQLLARNSIREHGSILFISSISAHIGVHGVAAYSASKAALEGMARSLSIEAARKKMRVNCLAPGLVETPMFEAAQSTTGGLEETVAKYPLGIGKPEDVANAAIFFLSQASRWITGTTLVLDGGHTVG
jgi:NAD(P)-dependent dehydrogenase (short-subunit alcohol dehydrogenase family)